MNQKKTRLVLDVSNLTTEPHKFKRSGIQEVIYNTILAVAKIRPLFPNLEIILLPFMPKTLGRDDEFPQKHFLFTPEFVFKEIETQLGRSSKDVWGFDFEKDFNYQMTPFDIATMMTSADYLHFQCLTNLRYLLPFIVSRNSGLKNRISATVYDLVPNLFPEFCGDEMTRWFNHDYLVGLDTHVKKAICISRHTAIDLKWRWQQKPEKEIHVVQLPFAHYSQDINEEIPNLLNSYGLLKKQYFVYLGSIEPRKNIESLLLGFDLYKKMFGGPFKLLIIGGGGWKNSFLFEKISTLGCVNDIVFAPYIEDNEIDCLIQNSLGLALLSYYEGFGLPLARARALGVPVVTHLGSSLPEACGNGATYVDPTDPHSVAIGLKSILGSSSKTSPVSKYSWNDYTQKLVEAIVGE